VIGAMSKAGFGQHGYGYATSEVPPGWSDGDSNYTFREWSSDIILWCIACKVPVEKQAGNIVQQLQGNARKIGKSIDPAILQNGGPYDMEDGRGRHHYSGVSILMHQLALQFAPLEVETMVQTIADLLSFRRNSGETVDSALSRFGLLRSRAAHLGGFVFGPTGASWYLLHALGIPKMLWVMYLTPFQGNLPTTEEQLNFLVNYIRRQGHLFEKGGAADIGLAGNKTTNSTFVAAEATADPLQQHDPWQTASGSFMFGNASASSASHHSPADPWSAYQTGRQHEEASEWDEMSTSGTDDDATMTVPFEELAVYLNMPPEQAEHELREAYLLRKRLWRAYSGKPRRFVRRFQKRTSGKKGGKGNSAYNKSYGKGHFPAYQNGIPNAYPASGRKGNPIDRKTGAPMKCHQCGSTSHLLRECPDKDKQQHRSYVTDTGHPAHAVMEQSGPLAGVLVPSTPAGGSGLSGHSLQGHYYNASTNVRKEPVANQGKTAASAFPDSGLHFLTSGQVYTVSAQQHGVSSSDSGHASGPTGMNELPSNSSGQNQVLGVFDASMRMLRPRPIDANAVGRQSSASAWYVAPRTEYETPHETSAQRQTQRETPLDATAQEPQWPATTPPRDTTEAAQDGVDWWYEQTEEPEEGTELTALDGTGPEQATATALDGTGPELTTVFHRTIHSESSEEENASERASEEPLLIDDSAKRAIKENSGASSAWQWNLSHRGGAKTEDERRAQTIAELKSIPGVGLFTNQSSSAGSKDKMPGAEVRSFYYPTSVLGDGDDSEGYAFHTRVRLSGDREGLLVDLGAHDNLTGSRWVERVQSWLHRNVPEQTVQSTPLKRNITIEGVGSKPDQCARSVSVPLHLESGERASYNAPVIENSDVPALLGMKSLSAKRAIVDVSGKTISFPGPGKAEIKLPPGSKQYKLEETPTGHLLLPVTELLSNPIDL